MPTPALKIDFVSDVSCPWCAIGLASLEQALERVAPQIQATVHFQPFELNPGMGPDGEDIGEHLQRKYGISAEQVTRNAEGIRQRGEAVGFRFGAGLKRRIWNTRDAHQLLHWAGLQGPEAQRRLKHALFSAYFTEGESPADRALLVRLAAACGLDPAEAQAVLDEQRFAAAVAAAEGEWHANGVSSVPTLVINDRFVITGGQPPETFERALRHIAEAAQQA